MGLNQIIIEDNVVNEGDRKEPFMILYHINFGYPFLNPDCEIVIPSREIRGWDEFSSKNIHRHLEIAGPEANMPELTYCHDLYCDESGLTGFMVTNKKTDPDIGVMVKYDRNVLDNLTQWKYLRRKDYVMALEPCNNLVKGIDNESKNGNLKFLEPGESITLSLEVTFMGASDEIEKGKDYLNSLKR